MDTFTAKVYRYIREKELLTAGDRVVAGVSGGSDSICLLLVLSELKSLLGLQLVAVHVNHGLRAEESDGDEDFTRNFCRMRGIPCYVFSENIMQLAKQEGWSVEEAGRNYRYRCFTEVMQREEADKIAVAHHLDDQSETVLMNLLRGSGLDGLAGMHAKRGSLIRPLLCVRKEEILAYLERNKVTFRTDHTNFETEHTRNRIRRCLLPWIREEINAGADVHLAQTAEILADAADYIHHQAQEAASQIVSCGSFSPLSESACEEPFTAVPCEDDEAEVVRIHTGRFLLLPKTLQREVVRLALTHCGKSLKDIGCNHIEAVISLAGGRTGAGISLPCSIQAEKSYEYLILSSGKESEAWGERSPQTGQTAGAGTDEDAAGEAFPACLPPLISGSEISVQTPCIRADFSLVTADQVNLAEIPQKIYTKWFDYDKIKIGLCVRRRQTGDYMEISQGRRKRLRRILIDEKMPASDRDELVVLADGSHILAAAGMKRISEYYKVTEKTRLILKVQWQVSARKKTGGN